MSVLSPTVKAKAGVKAAKGAAKYPGILKVGAKAGAPVVKRRARKRVVGIGDAARDFGETIVTYGPQAAQELGLVPAPKPKRTLGGVFVGVLIGAGAALLLNPKVREKLTGAVG